MGIRRCNSKRISQRNNYCIQQIYCYPANPGQINNQTCNTNDTFISNTINQPTIQNLHISRPIDSQKDIYSKVITFNVKNGEIPKISYSGTFSDRSYFIGRDGTFNPNDISINNDAVYMTKKTVRDLQTGELRDTYTIGVKKNCNINFKIANKEVNYNAPVEPSLTPSPQPIQPSKQTAPTTVPIKANNFSKTNNSDILPLSNSGDVQYPSNHSVFTSNVQDKVSYSYSPPDDTKVDEYLESNSSDYRKIPYGSLHMRELAYEISQGKGLISIEEALTSATKTINKNDDKHKPLYRLSDKCSFNDVKDFEVLVFTGTTYEKRFKFDADMLKHSVKATCKDSCKEFTILESPNEDELEDAIKIKAKSCQENGRKLYIFYRGHGNYNGIQKGISSDDKSKEGSYLYNFQLDSFKSTVPDENYLKGLYQKYLKDIETTTVIGSCHSGAAVTATEQDAQKRYFNSLA